MKQQTKQAKKTEGAKKVVDVRVLYVELPGDLYDRANGMRASSRLKWREVLEQALGAWMAAKAGA